jgi:hypothetical protein
VLRGCSWPVVGRSSSAVGCSWSTWSAVALAFLLPLSTATAAVRHVYADGTGDAPTIQAVLDLAADHDTVLVGPGTYHEHNVLIHTPHLALVSSDGAAETILEAAGGGQGFAVVGSSMSGIIRGFTIIGAEGAGISIDPSGAADHEISDCVILQCGAGVYAHSYFGKIRNVTAAGGVAGANSGSGFSLTYSAPTLINCIVAFNEGYGIVSWSETPPDVQQCCCVYGNAGGDYFHVDDPTGTQGNISLDPCFCDYPGGDLRLAENSPCAPQSPQNPAGEQVGALHVACSFMPTTATSWGSLKARFKDR